MSNNVQLKGDEDERIDCFESLLLLSGEPVEMPVKHTFTPGMYIREIFMPAGTLLTSKVHNTEHPYAILEGSAKVYVPGVGVQELKAGHSGVTKAGTRRVLLIEEDCRWVCYHPLSVEEEQARLSGSTEDEILDFIEDRIIDKRPLEQLDGASTNDIYKELLEGGQKWLG